MTPSPCLESCFQWGRHAEGTSACCIWETYFSPCVLIPSSARCRSASAGWFSGAIWKPKRRLTSPLNSGAWRVGEFFYRRQRQRVFGGRLSLLALSPLYQADTHLTRLSGALSVILYRGLAQQWWFFNDGSVAASPRPAVTDRSYGNEQRGSGPDSEWHMVWVWRWHLWSDKTLSHTPRDPSITPPSERLDSQGILSGFVLVSADAEVWNSYPVPAVAQRRILMSVQPTRFEQGVTNCSHGDTPASCCHVHLK